MSDEETQEQPEEKLAEPNNTGLLILQQLQIINKLLGSINQNITSTLQPIVADIELCKVHLAKIRKAGPGEFVTPAEKPAPYVPPMEG